MKKIIQKAIAFIMAVSLCTSVCSCTSDDGQDLKQMIDQTAEGLQSFSETGILLDDAEMFPAGNSSSDWIAMTLAFSHSEDAFENYLHRLQVYVGEAYENEGYLHRVKATEYHRIALTMLALGGDPSKVEYQDKTIDLIADGTWNFHAGSPGLQGSNGLIYALLSLDAMDYQIPSDAVYTRQTIVEELLEYQQPDGGISLDSSLGGDIDITAMAVQALAPYADQPEVKTALERALLWLADNMTEKCTFTYHGDENTESCAQVILALCALGMDPAENEMFMCGDKNLLDGMAHFRTKDGMYKHVEDEEEYNIMATYQALLALEAVEALRSEARWIFDFREYTPPGN